MYHFKIIINKSTDYDRTCTTLFVILSVYVCVYLLKEAHAANESVHNQALHNITFNSFFIPPLWWNKTSGGSLRMRH